MKVLCPLCRSDAGSVFYSFAGRDYFKCNACDAVFMDRSSLPDRSEEETRYKEHNNDVYDSGYRAFVKPVVDAVCSDFACKSIGLDFGAGTGPVISKMLSEKGYAICQYDPFFHPDESLLDNKYDYIVSCEVIEHFHNPAREFQLLRSMLERGGKLYCKTSLFKTSMDFGRWHYKNDPTHVFFYSEKTFEIIRRMFDFKTLEIFGTMIIFGT